MLELFGKSMVLKLLPFYGRFKSYLLLFFKQITLGTVPIPKSSNAGRLAENINVFDFTLNTEELQQLEKLDCNLRMCPFQPDAGHKYFPFNIEF